MRKRFGRNDIILISVIVIISVALLLIWKLVYLKGQDTDSDACVEVTIDGRAYGTYPLSKDDTIEIKNGDGDITNTLVIKGGVADMTSADCPDLLCVKQKAISKEGELIPEHFYRKNEINENQKDCISWYAYGTGTGAKLC